MKKILRNSLIAGLSVMILASCEDDDSNPIDPGTNPSASYVSFEQGSYWVYESETYDDPDGNNMTERDSTAVTSEEEYQGRAAYEYTTWTQVEGSYDISNPVSVEYYSEEEGDIYLHASSINDRLATEEVKAIIDISIPDVWLQILDGNNTSIRTIQEVNIDDTDIVFNGVDGRITNGKLMITSQNKGKTSVAGANGATYDAVTIELLFTITGDVSGTLFGTTITGTLTGNTNYTIWVAEDNGIVKTDFQPFTANVNAINQEFEIFSAAGTRNTIITSAASPDSN